MISAGIASQHSLVPRYTAGDLATSPRVVFYELTQACPLACVHCRASARLERDPEELSLAEGRRLLGQLAEFPRPPLVVLTGGDPMQYPDLLELVACGARLGLEMALTPAASPRVTPAALGTLRAAGLRCVALSLDGADATTHDAFRGVTGSFDQTLQIARQVRAAGLALQINTTLHTANLHQIDLFAEQVAELGARMWSVFFLVPLGRAADKPRLSPLEYEFAFAALSRHAAEGRFMLKTTEAPHYRRFVVERGGARQSESRRATFPLLGVNDGKGVMFIGHTGEICPSGFLPISAGAFPRDSVVEVYQNSPLFRQLRDSALLEGKCGACKYRGLCGGSRARAFAVTGNLFAEEPDCAYFPEGWPVAETQSAVAL